MTSERGQSVKRTAYPAYKPSGVEWLGEIPEHWEVWKVTHGFERLGSGTTPKSDLLQYYDGDIPWVTTSELRERVIKDTHNKLTQAAVRDYSGLRLYPAGTLLFAMYGATIGRMGVLGIPATVNQACAAFVGPTQLTAEFTFYWLSMRRPTLIALSAGGGQPNLSQDVLRLVRIPAPLPDEQRAIAAFLDRETARIDALIEKKRRQIALLQEKRSALISHAVTKGLDPDAPMKDSGIEWLGKVPEHWEVKRLRFLVSEPLKYGANESAELDDPDLPRYIRITDVDENGRLRDETFKSLPEDVARPYLLKEGDLLLARSGATVGKSFYYEPSWGRAAYAGYLIRARFNPARMMPRFVNYFTNSQQYWQWLASSFIQATIQNVSAEKYANLFIPTPSLHEQARVVAYLDAVTQMIDDLREKVHSSIQQLKDYRTALISAAVTGKIDVREEVPG